MNMTMATFPVYKVCKVMGFSRITVLSVVIISILMPQNTQTASDISAVSFETLYRSGISSYNHKKWPECYDYLTKSLEEYKLYKQSIVDCKSDCRSEITSENETVLVELAFLKFALRNSDCLRRCKSGKIDAQLESDVSKKVIEEFDSLKPYDYLQLCAFKLEKYKVAASSAYTFFLGNPDHDVMKKNIGYYQGLQELKLEDFVNLEKKKYQASFDKVNELYGLQDYKNTAVAAEDTLREYYIEVAQCEMMCEGEVGNVTGKDLYNIIADQWIDVLQCQTKCPQKLSLINGEVMPNFLPELYNYLQFAYYKDGSMSLAAQATASFLLFKPDDEMMVSNKEYYISDEGLKLEDFVPFKAAMTFHQRQKMFGEMLDFVGTEYTTANPKPRLKGPREDEYDRSDVSVGAKTKKATTETPAKKALKIKGDPGEKNPLWKNRSGESGLGVEVDENNQPALAALGPRDEDFLSSLDKYMEENSLKLSGEEEELKGKTRVAVDGLLTEEQCGQIKQLAMVGGSQGDGYEGTEKRSSPHTNYEKFQGVTIKKAAELAISGEVTDKLAESYLNASESARVFLQTYYNLKQTLYFHFTHLVCRTALSDQSGREDLSHPIHADNCLMKPDHSCVRKRPAYTERDFSALLYLNGDFEGGDFFFTDRELSPEQSVRPECGRMVGFEASTYHGVKAVTKGTRCAVALWFTLDKQSQETSHDEARMVLQGMHSRKKVLNNPVLESLVKQHGYEVVMTESELNGPERFVSDKVASQDQCEMLVQLANQAGSVGDGYNFRKDKSSPHTDHEEFKGLDLTKAAKDDLVQGAGYSADTESSDNLQTEINDGLTLIRAAQLADGSEASVDAVNLYLQLSENARELTEKYFNLKQTLYFDYTHLVCRKALDELVEKYFDLSQKLYFDYTHLVCRKALDDSNTGRNDLSHPVHSDNCIIQPDGECLKERPAYIQRDYSALLYLSDEFQGGDFFFAHKNFSVQSSVRPKCGRLVSFNASNYHGVKAVLSGQRCAIALWFTLDPIYKEAAHGIARNILDNIGKPKLQEPASTGEGVHDGGEL